MKKILEYTICFLIFSAIWVVLNEELSVVNIVIGGLLGLVCIFVTNKLLMTSNYITTYSFNLPIIIKYSFYLVYRIYYSGIITIKKIVLGQVNPSIVNITSEIKKDFYVNLISNSITLTPGTVTVSKEGKRIKILTVMDTEVNKKKKGVSILSGFEKILKGR